MCGLTGFWDFKGSHQAPLQPIVQAMSARIQERGPDSSGDWCDETLGLALGHQRLAIVDLSPAGHQPMVSASQASILAYNGEIYNAAELRKELVALGSVFRGHSDTEVILEACERWGVLETCQRLIGMFAFAFWDRKNRVLSLARDRLGVKPLYYGFHRGIFFFGSQIKSFQIHPTWKPILNKQALVSYFRFGYVPSPLSIFEGIQKLPPGNVLYIDQAHALSQTITLERFWDLQKIASAGQQNPYSFSDIQAIDALDALLQDAVKRRMIADVPLGAFLSGGIDSSTVAALMQSSSNRPIQTFSIGFQEADYNEAQHAAMVAKHLGTEHHELYLSSDETLGIIAQIPKFFDEPFADSSQIPTFCVSHLARQHVKVALSGDGGDELFAGYNRYVTSKRIWENLRPLPYWLRHLFARGIFALSPQSWDRVLSCLPTAWHCPQMGDKVHKFANILTAKNRQMFYKTLVSHWQDPTSLVNNTTENSVYPWSESEDLFAQYPMIESLQLMDTLTYLPDDILTKVDRASMAVGLEARVPLLDHRLVEFAWHLPMRFKIRNHQSKWLLKQVLARYVPAYLIDRPKMGFGIPLDHWLRGALRPWAETLLSFEKLQADGILNPKPIRQKWEEHLSGKRNWQSSLWAVLMFQAWKEEMLCI